MILAHKNDEAVTILDRCKEIIEVYADSFVALNGRPSQRFIDPNVNLYAEKESFRNKSWILPLNDEIKGL